MLSPKEIANLLGKSTMRSKTPDSMMNKNKIMNILKEYEQSFIVDY